MMKTKTDLSQFHGKRVFVRDTNDESYTGKVTTFVYGKDNETGDDAIVIDDAVWLEAPDIADIREL